MAQPKSKKTNKKPTTKASSKPAANPKRAKRTRGVHGTISRHYYSYMPNKRHHRVLVWTLFLLVVGIIAAQMLYPPSRALPLARLSGQSVGWQQNEQLAKTINQQFMSTKVVLTTKDGQTNEYSLGEAGAEPQTGQMVDRLTTYPFWQRFIPLSIFFQQIEVSAVEVDFNQVVLKEFAHQASQAMSYPPQDAGLAIKDGELVSTEDKVGQKVSSGAIQAALEKASFELNQKNTVTVAVKSQTAATTAADFAAVKAKALAALGRSVVIVADGQTFQASRAEKASWLTIDSDTAGAPILGFDDQELTEYLQALDKKVGRPAGTTHVTVVDGKETERDLGRSGRKINKPPVVELTQNWLVGGVGDGIIQAELVDVAPQVLINNKYTSSQAGLRAYVSDAAKEQHANIVVRQLDGQGWSAQASGSLSTVSASTYKLYVALVLFEKMDQGKIAWGDPMLDTTVSGCFDRMTIASTNPCPVAWLDQFGRTYIENYLYQHGFSRGTDFTNLLATHTTANDLTKFMVGLENGSLIDGAQRDRLLHSLRVHPYRSGVPAGSAGQVWDKVGFLWDYVHDTAIVHHPKGKYVITVMTKGESYATIAAITREVERIMYP